MSIEAQLHDREGWKWPGIDKYTWSTVRGELSEIPAILDLVAEKRVCIQAGGNGGLWVRPLAEAFDHVYTFEPDPVMFRCLVHNIDRANVTFINAALGNEPGLMHVETVYPPNPGANRMEHGGRVPCMTIDGLKLEDVDLIQLDIEGMELYALHGAEATIRAHRPVIVVELRRHSNHYGHTDQHVRDFITSLGYRHAGRMNSDEFFVPA